MADKFYDPCPFPGINRKVFGKTRIIQKFIWFKTLNKKCKILQTAYILQRCLKNMCGVNSGYDPVCGSTKEKNEKYLDWYDVEWSEKQKFFLKCPDCDNELTASGSFISDDKNGVAYKCTDCGRESLWNFDLGPAPVEITRKEKCQRT